MYHTVFLDERVALTPSELNNVHNVEGISEMLLTKLKEKHEGKCNTNGYVKPGSVSILGRSMGIAENGRFTGNILYDCKIKCEVLYPVGGAEFDAFVIKVNKMGAYAHYDEAIRILLPRDLHIGNAEFDTINEGDIIRVSLVRSRFQANDPFIMAVGTHVGTRGGGVGAAVNEEINA
jgi:DNA-directed RNA polymerase subunit E'/Rpb7